MMRILSFFCILASLYSCKSVHYNPKNYKAIQLTIGSSGGVTGTIKEFTLLDNGYLFLSKGVTGEMKEQKIIRRSETHRIFQKAEDLGLGKLKFNHPGNMTYYIILKKPKVTSTIKWGESGISAPAGIKEFYDQLLSVFQP